MAEFEVGVLQDFIARHFLFGADFGPEGSLHSHRYRVEVTVRGRRLDRHGFVVDIVQLRAELDRVVERLREQTLNDLPEFAGVNPGAEALARVIGESLAGPLADRELSSLSVKVWENDTAWASYHLHLSSK